MSNKILSFLIQSELNLVPDQAACRRYLELALLAAQSETHKERLPLNLALVIDRSGSMGGEKLEYVKQAALHVLELLTPNDRVSLVAFDDQVYNLSDSVPVTPVKRAELRAIISEMQVGGGTNLGGGWLQGCKNAALVQLAQGVNRSLLLTDGEANHGITEPEELGMHAREIHSRGVSTSTFGVGMGFNEHLLEYMANQGGGNFYFIDSPHLISEIFMREFKELADVAARDVEIELSIPVEVGVKVLGSWKHERDGLRLRIFPGDLPAGVQREIYLKLEFPPQAQAPQVEISAVCRAKGENAALLEEKANLVFRYASPAEVDAASPDQALLERASVVEVASAAGEALKLEREGLREEAHQMLSSVLGQVSPSMPAPEAQRYSNLADRMQHGLNEMDRKASQYTSYTSKRRRQ